MRKLRVAVIDTGMDVTRDYKGLNIKSRNVLNQKGLPVTEDTLYHGSMVLDTLANHMREDVKRDSEILMYQVFNGSVGDFGAMTRAVRLSIIRGADVICLSLGFAQAHSIVFNEALREASKQGVIIFGAMGNEGVNRAYYPASEETVHGVIGLNEKGIRHEDSNYWTKKDASMVWSDDFVGKDFDGTSYSNALVVAKFSNLLYDEIRANQEATRKDNREFAKKVHSKYRTSEGARIR